MAYCDIVMTDLAKKYFNILHNVTTQDPALTISQITDPRNNITLHPNMWSAYIDKIRQELEYEIDNEIPGSRYAACKVYHFVWRYIPPIIFLLGSVGNLMAFLVLCHRSMIQVSFYVYLATLAIVDEMVLVFGLLRHWMDRLIGQRIEDMSPALCRISQITGTSTSYLSVWLIVALTVERLIVVVLPLKASRIATPKRAKILTSILVTVSILMSLHFLVTVDLITTYNPKVPHKSNSTDPNEQRKSCELRQGNLGFNSFFAWADATLYSYLPFSMITIINIILRFYVHRAGTSRATLTSNYCRHQKASKSSHDQPTGSLNQNQTASARQSVTNGRYPTAHHDHKKPQLPRGDGSRQLTVILFSVSCTFLITTLPIVVIKFLRNVKYSAELSTTGNVYFHLADTLAELLMHVNHAMNFYLYCATGQRFRQQLFALVGSRRATDRLGFSAAGNNVPLGEYRSVSYCHASLTNRHSLSPHRYADHRNSDRLSGCL